MSNGIGLVFAGGGGKGAYQIGVWKALKEYGIDKNIVAVSGTSVGALNAALFAQGDFEIAERVWLNISNDQILKIDSTKYIKQFLHNFGKIVNLTIAKSLFKVNGIFSRDGLLDIIESSINFDFLRSASRYCFVTCCAFPQISPEYFNVSILNSDTIKKVLLATSALPIIFDTVEINGQDYFDGGVIDNIPIKPLYEHGLSTILVVHLSRDGVIDERKYPNSRILQIVPREHQGDLLSGTLDFESSGARNRIQQGYEDAVRILKPIFEMGLVQEKIGQTLGEIRNDEIKFKHVKSSIQEHKRIIADEFGIVLEEK